MSDPTLDELDQELSQIAVPGLSFDDAWRLGTIIRDLAVARNLGVAIDVHRGEQGVFRTALPGSSAINDDWIQRKIRTVWKYGVSSLAIRIRAGQREGGFPWLDQTIYAIAGGCVPLRTADGAVIGTVTVSGLADTEDHALVVEGIRAFLAA